MDVLELLTLVARRALSNRGIEMSEAEFVAQIDREAALMAFEAPFLADNQGVLLHPEPHQQAAILAARIVGLVPMPHGIERSTALLFADLRLQLSGLELQASAHEVHSVFAALSEGRMSDALFVRWFDSHTKPLRTLT